MKGATNETVGDDFNVDSLKEARDKTLEVIETALRQIYVGMTENQAKALIKEIQQQIGIEREWHAPQIRFGQNTTLSFGQKGIENNSLKENDILFFDLGLVYNGHEGDVGRPLVIGKNSEMERCCHDVESIWNMVRDRWCQTNEAGNELYSFARKTAKDLGWDLKLKEANGHRIADFPHIAKQRGSIEFFEGRPAKDRWILEIQITDPKRRFGAFYEDLLN